MDRGRIQKLYLATWLFKSLILWCNGSNPSWITLSSQPFSYIQVRAIQQNFQKIKTKQGYGLGSYGYIYN